MWALSNYTQSCGIALVDGVDLELTTFLSRHDEGELYVLVGFRNLYGIKRMSRKVEYGDATYLTELDGAELRQERQRQVLYKASGCKRTRNCLHKHRIAWHCHKLRLSRL